MNFSWNVFVDLGLIACSLLIATGIRVRVRFFQRYLIPNALTAGFLLLPLYNYVLPWFGRETHDLGDVVYHLLSVSFIAMTLRSSESNRKASSGNVGSFVIAVLSQIGIQGLVGLLFTAVLIQTALPDLFPSFGLFLTLGFSQGPGQAFAIGSGWEPFGFEGAASIGLTFAALGFIVSSFGGIALINIGVRRGWLSSEQVAALKTSALKRGVFPSSGGREIGAHLTTDSEAIDSFTLHIALVLFVYMLTYFLLLGITAALALASPSGALLANSLWALSFIFAALIAMVVKALMRGAGWHFVVDNKTLNRICGFSVDVMVTAAIGAIAIVVVWRFIVPILALSLLGTVLTMVLVPWMSSRLFIDHAFHRAMLVFGAMTGTLSTGLALLRVVDPEFETPVAGEYMYAAGIVFALAIPFIVAFELPVRAAVTGDMRYFWAMVVVAGVYVIATGIAFLLVARRRAWAGGARLWLRSSATATE